MRHGNFLFRREPDETHRGRGNGRGGGRGRGVGGGGNRNDMVTMAKCSGANFMATSQGTSLGWDFEGGSRETCR